MTISVSIQPFDLLRKFYESATSIRSWWHRRTRPQRRMFVLGAIVGTVLGTIGGAAAVGCTCYFQSSAAVAPAPIDMAFAARMATAVTVLDNDDAARFSAVFAYWNQAANLGDREGELRYRHQLGQLLIELRRSRAERAAVLNVIERRLVDDTISDADAIAQALPYLPHEQQAAFELLRDQPGDDAMRHRVLRRTIADERQRVEQPLPAMAGEVDTDSPSAAPGEPATVPAPAEIPAQSRRRAVDQDDAVAPAAPNAVNAVASPNGRTLARVDADDRVTSIAVAVDASATEASVDVADLPAGTDIVLHAVDDRGTVVAECSSATEEPTTIVCGPGDTAALLLSGSNLAVAHIGDAMWLLQAHGEITRLFAIANGGVPIELPLLLTIADLRVLLPHVPGLLWPRLRPSRMTWLG